MLNKKMLRDIRNNKVQFISIFIMIFLGVLVYTGINAEWYGMQVESNKLYNDCNLADLWLYGNNITDDTINNLEKVDGIKEIEKRLVVDVSPNLGNEEILRLNVVDKNKISTSTVIKGENFDINSDGIWIDVDFATQNNLNVGDELKLTFNGMEIVKSIKGIVINPEYVYAVKDETELVPNHKLFGYAYVSDKFVNVPIYNQILIDTKTEDTSNVEKNIPQKNDNSFILLNRNEHISYKMFDEEIITNRMIGQIFPVVFFLIAILSTLTTMTRIVENQRTQIGTLKALGFKNRKILWHYLSYGLVISMLGGVLGIIVGPILLPYILFTLQKATYTLPIWKASIQYSSSIIIFLGIILVSLVTYFVCKKELKEKPVDILRPKSPEDIKEKSFSNSKLLRHLNFNFKWNIRDIFRNKMRSIMVIFGVMSSMMLFLCAMGCNDSIKDLSNWMYNELNKYETKSIFKSDTTYEQKLQINEKYNGELLFEGSIEIKSNNETKITQVTVADGDELINYQDEKRNNIALSDEGIAISYKIAQNMNLKIGDKVSWHLYGDDNWYESKITNIYRTPFSQGVAFSYSAFKKYGLEFNPTSCISLSTNIQTDPNIDTIQYKSDLIANYNNLIESMQMMIEIMIFASILLGIVVLYNLGVLSFSEKIRELATLKVLGFGSKRLRKLLFTRKFDFNCFRNCFRNTIRNNTYSIYDKRNGRKYGYNA